MDKTNLTQEVNTKYSNDLPKEKLIRGNLDTYLLDLLKKPEKFRKLVILQQEELAKHQEAAYRKRITAKYEYYCWREEEKRILNKKEISEFMFVRYLVKHNFKND